MRIFLAAVAVIFSTAASAQDLKTCAALTDDAERVKCYDRLAGRDPNKPVSDYAASCEMKLLQQLIAPAGYKRVGIEETYAAMSLEAYVDEEFIAIRDRNLQTPDIAVQERAAVREQEARLRSSGGQVQRHRVVITYDAPNRAGSLVRGDYTCTDVEVPK